MTLFGINPSLFATPGLPFKYYLGSRSKTYSQVSCELLSRLFEFLEPRNLELNDLEDSILATAVDHGMLLDVESKEFVDALQWSSYNWQRAACLIQSQQDLIYLEHHGHGNPRQSVARVAGPIVKRHPKTDRVERTSRKVASGTLSPHLTRDIGDIRSLIQATLSRRSCRRYSSQPITVTRLDAITGTLVEALRGTYIWEEIVESPEKLIYDSYFRFIDLWAVILGTEGLDSGIYRLDVEEAKWDRMERPLSRIQLKSALQGQGWASEGGGIGLFILLNVFGYQELYRHSRAYISLAVQAGEVAQMVLSIASEVGLASCVSPALSEAITEELLGSESGTEPFNFVRIGWPE